MPRKEKPQDLKKISSHSFSRGLSLLGWTLSSGAQYASMKLNEILASPQSKDLRLQNFMLGQAEKLVSELGKLKGSIMKAGQMLSVYGEHFFPAPVNDILKTLQSQSRPVVWEEMRKVLEKQLGPKKFKALDIDEVPIAAASMGQVYRTQIKGEPGVFAIKVQYPGVDKAIESDLSALKTVLSLSHLLPSHPGFEEIFKEVRMVLHYEADYERELAFILQYQNWLNTDSRFKIPAVRADFSTKRILTMSYEEGVCLDSQDLLSLSDLRRTRLGVSLLDLLFKEIFEWRTVQTDPHFGNFRVQLGSREDGLDDRLVLFDFGAVREFPRTYIDPFAKLVGAALTGDKESLIKAGLTLGFLRSEDPQNMLDLFFQMSMTAIEPFTEAYASSPIDGTKLDPKAYDWGTSELLKQTTALVKDAAFTFKLRPPPREAVFLDRKMIGIYVILSKLGVKFGPRNLLMKYL
ncbi:MAG: AarF/ABC1/UbiB kinase family protein [Oligoflexales bacterium]|nr:AarF/ABC1/UbiB kinase family protein [Oligoflexales bacterium]